jgi:hypothetical protein
LDVARIRPWLRCWPSSTEGGRDGNQPVNGYFEGSRSA